MALENGKWRVVRGDNLWNICKSVYNDPYRWRDVANANGISQTTALIYPGQLLTLPDISSDNSTPVTSTTTVSKAVTINWWALDADTTRDMFCTWSYNRTGVTGYEYKTEYNTGSGGWRIDSTGTVEITQLAYSAPANAIEVRVTITPKSDDWTDGEATTVSYNFSNNPPLLPPSPSIEISSNNTVIARLDNISEDINADTIEFSLYQDDNIKYKTINASINTVTMIASIETNLDPGHSYKIRCRAVRGTIYGGYTEFSEMFWSLPIAPEEITTLRVEKINEQISSQYAIQAEWSNVSSAKMYLIEWATNISLLGTDQSSSKVTSEDDGPRTLITGIAIGLEYFFRVASINDQGQSVDWSSIKSVKIGTKPSPPTTYSNVDNCILGEDLKLYWIHNSTDGSYESTARIQLTVEDSAHPDLEPLIITKVIPNDKTEEEQGQPSVYIINTNDPEWATVGEGFNIKWKVQTAGVIAEYSDWSTEREVAAHAKPEISIDILNNNQISVDEVNTFPFYLSVLSTPPAQTPISYYIEIISNDYYETVDDTGKTKVVNIGDQIFVQTYDPQINPWRFLLELSPNNLDLENNKTYNINIVVSLNSGLTAKTTKQFIAVFEDIYHDVYGDVTFNKDTLTTSIKPYCYENLNVEKITTSYYPDETSMTMKMNNDLRSVTITAKPNTLYRIIRPSMPSYIKSDNMVCIICSHTELVNTPDCPLLYYKKYPNNQQIIEYYNESASYITVTWCHITYDIFINHNKELNNIIQSTFAMTLVSNCSLTVFRREYDSSFKEILSNIKNNGEIYVVDPHPSLDYGRYRIVAKMNDTGAISFADIKPLPINFSAAVIQWSEDWSSYTVGENGEGMIEPPWSGSMVIIPYNVSISNSKSIDNTLVEYAGRENPVSYYGTHIGETSSWTMSIPKEDKELLNSIRRLSKWKGDVYVRESYGTGYWANISVSYTTKYLDVIIPITINVKKVEGGI